MEAVIDPKNLYSVLELLRDRNGQAPGVDRIRFDDPSRPEWYEYFRKMGDRIRAGNYRPQPTLPVEIPKPNGSFRTLKLPVVADRVLAKAIAMALDARTEARFLPNSYGFRRQRNIFALFADLKRQCESNQAWVITADDVHTAFDSVVISRAMESLHRLGADPGLIRVAETVIRGHDSLKETGISQGCPLSPLTLNLFLHDALDSPFVREGETPVQPNHWYARYADNVLVVTRTAQQGAEELERMRSLLGAAQLSLKGDPGIPRNLQSGENLELLGLLLDFHQGKLRFRIPNSKWADLKQRLIDSHYSESPSRTARDIITGWIQPCGPTFGDPRNDMEQQNRILNLLMATNHRDALDRRELIAIISSARERWSPTTTASRS